jgi:hypothetical protein
MIDIPEYPIPPQDWPQLPAIIAPSSMTFHPYIPGRHAMLNDGIFILERHTLTG